MRDESAASEVAPPPPDAEPPAPPAPAPRARRRNYAWPFGVCLVVGVLLVIAVPSPFPPLAVMVGYLAYGLATARREGAIVEFSDSFYYLGFALTLLSLVHGLGALGGQPKLQENVLATFGQALLTTIAGVIGRIWVQLFYRTAQERIEQTQREMELLSERFLEELEDLSRRLSSTMQESVGALEKQLPAHTRAITDQLSSSAGALLRTTGALQRISDHSLAFAAQMEALPQAQRRLEGALGALTGTTELAAERMDAAVGELGSSLQQAGTQMASAAEAQLEAFRRAAEALRLELEKVGAAGACADQLRASLAGAREEVDGLGNLVDEIAVVVRDRLRSLAS